MLAGKSIRPRPSLAPGFPEDPVAHDLLREAEGHHDDAEGQVGHGERRHEPEGRGRVDVIQWRHESKGSKKGMKGWAAKVTFEHCDNLKL